MNLNEVSTQIEADQQAGKFTTPDSAPDTTQSSAPETSQQQQLADLEKMERFTFKGKEWTPKDLESSILMQSDYTKKTQSLAEERKYFENLPYDLQRVASNPQLADEFKKIYPEKFHSYLTAVENQNNQAQPQEPSQQQQPKVDQELLSRLEKIETVYKEQEIKVAETKIDQVFQKLSKKYEYADEEQVLARAQHALGKGEKLDDANWDKIFKTVNDYNQTRFEGWQKKQVANQKEAHSKARDIGGGGGIPGQAPKRMSFKEAEEAMIRDLGGR